MNIFQRKNSKKVKEADGSPKKDKDRSGKNGRFDRAKAGLETLAANIESAKTDAKAATQKLQGDVKSGIDAIVNTGSAILDKARTEFGSHAEATPSKELEQGSEEQGAKNMEAFNAVLDKVKSNPEVVGKVKDEVMNLAEALHLTKHEPEAEEKAKDGEAAQNADESTSAGQTGGLAAVQHAVEEIQGVVAGVQQQQQTAGDETETADASAEGEKPEAAATREVEKDDQTKRIDFLGFFAMLFERFCSPANKKKD